VISVDAFLLSYKREENLETIIRGVKRQSFIRDIYVLHNFPSKVKLEGVINIVSAKNFGCIFRHSIALLSDADYVLFVDDDIELTVDFSMRFMEAIKRSPRAVIGLFGKNIKREDLENPYSKGKNVMPSKDHQFVDIVKGRVHLCARRELYRLFKFISDNKIVPQAGEDDVLLNLATVERSVLLPVEEGEYRNINSDDRNALYLSAGHSEGRDRLISEFF
jgi:glycosyltransferase involved in cell wall biosynthesis